MPHNECTNSERKIEINESTSINNFRYNVELVIYNINWLISNHGCPCNDYVFHLHLFSHPFYSTKGKGGRQKKLDLLGDMSPSSVPH